MTVVLVSYGEEWGHWHISFWGTKRSSCFEKANTGI